MWEKQNLVTQSKGDQWKCSHCGYKFWSCRLGANDSTCPKCDCLAGLEHPVEMSGKPLGGWYAPAAEKAYDSLVELRAAESSRPSCAGCRGPLVIVPRTRHPLSDLWRLERQDGLALMCCAGDCKEP